MNFASSDFMLVHHMKILRLKLLIGNGIVHENVASNVHLNEEYCRYILILPLTGTVNKGK